MKERKREREKQRNREREKEKKREKRNVKKTLKKNKEYRERRLHVKSANFRVPFLLCQANH